MNNGQSSSNASGKTGNPQNVGTPNLLPQNNQLQGSGTNASNDVITIPAANTKLPSVPLSSVTTSAPVSTPEPAKAPNSTMTGIIIGIVILLIAASVRFAQQGNKTSLSKR